MYRYEYIYQFLGANYFNKKCKISGKVKFVENGTVDSPNSGQRT